MSPRPVDLARLGLGVVAIARPDMLLRASTEPHGGRGKDRVVVRVLGTRYLLQAAAGVGLDRPWMPALDAATDLTHAATMLGLAALDRSHRRIALLSAAVATGFAVADLRDRHAVGAR